MKNIIAGWRIIRWNVYYSPRHINKSLGCLIGRVRVIGEDCGFNSRLVVVVKPLARYYRIRFWYITYVFTSVHITNTLRKWKRSLQKFNIHNSKHLNITMHWNIYSSFKTKMEVKGEGPKSLSLLRVRLLTF